MSRGTRRALLALAVLACLWALAQLLRAFTSFWIVVWLLMLWAGVQGQ